MTKRTLFFLCALLVALCACLFYNASNVASSAFALDSAAVQDDDDADDDDDDADDDDDDAKFASFRDQTMSLAREGKLDELRALATSELSVREANWVDYMVTSASLDVAIKAEDRVAVVGVVDSIITRFATEWRVAYRFDEYCDMLAVYDSELAVRTLKQGYEIAKKSTDKRYQRMAKTLVGKIRYAQLPGKKMKVEGLLVNGKPIKWKSYRGQVVLVDFWATWCGPCREEIPNLRKLYAKYHDAGFEIISYSVDDELDDLRKFLRKNDMPWKVASRELSITATKKNGNAYLDLIKYYGIDGYPTMILVDKDGKVVALDARGEELEKLLKKLFPKVK